jgi:NAD(P)-dependent dehydrogenase (short-subunit alcohol dehydrogenase family)
LAREPQGPHGRASARRTSQSGAHPSCDQESKADHQRDGDHEAGSHYRGRHDGEGGVHGALPRLLDRACPRSRRTCLCEVDRDRAHVRLIFEVTDATPKPLDLELDALQVRLDPNRVGHIVNISSVAGKSAVPYNAVYSSSKHALVGFSWSLREELKPYGIGVSVVCPGFVREAGMFADWSGGTEPPGLTRSVSPERVANATVDAIESDKAEIVVGSPFLRISDVVHALSPNLAGWIGRKSGAYRFLRSATDKTFRD